MLKLTLILNKRVVMLFPAIKFRRFGISAMARITKIVFPLLSTVKAFSLACRIIVKYTIYSNSRLLTVPCHR
jgi:hypothetical protein